MRTGIEKLAWMLAQEPGEATVGSLAEKYGEPMDRIMDALDVLKIRRGQPTQLPAIDWTRLPGTGSYTCPVCGRTSHNRNDVREGYCGNCHAYTSDESAGVDLALPYLLVTDVQSLIENSSLGTAGATAMRKWAQQQAIDAALPDTRTRDPHEEDK